MAIADSVLRTADECCACPGSRVRSPRRSAFLRGVSCVVPVCVCFNYCVKVCVGYEICVPTNAECSNVEGMFWMQRIQNHEIGHTNAKQRVI